MERETSQEALPGMELRDIVQDMSFLERIEYKRNLLREMSDRETLIHLINDVNAVEGQGMATGVE